MNIHDQWFTYSFWYIFGSVESVCVTIPSLCSVNSFSNPTRCFGIWDRGAVNRGVVRSWTVRSGLVSSGTLMHQGSREDMPFDSWAVSHLTHCTLDVADLTAELWIGTTLKDDIVENSCHSDDVRGPIGTLLYLMNSDSSIPLIPVWDIEK